MRRFLSIALLFSALAGCTGGDNPSTGGTETGNTSGLAIRVVGYQSSLADNPAALTIGDLSVTTAKVVLDRIRFRPFSACQDGAEDEGAADVRFDGPFVVDLLNPGPLNGLEDIIVPNGLYCRIELVLKKFEDEGGSSDPMNGKSVLIEGARNDGVPFQMVTEVDEEFELENETTGFSIEASDNFLQVFFIAFDLDQWFAGVDLNAPGVEVSGGPAILISDASNETIQETIEENLKFSSDLFKDSDHNETLDPEEQEDSLAHGAPVP